MSSCRPGLTIAPVMPIVASRDTGSPRASTVIVGRAAGVGAMEHAGAMIRYPVLLLREGGEFAAVVLDMDLWGAGETAAEAPAALAEAVEMQVSYAVQHDELPLLEHPAPAEYVTGAHEVRNAYVHGRPAPDERRLPFLPLPAAGGGLRRGVKACGYRELVKKLREHDPRFGVDVGRGKGSHWMPVRPDIGGRRVTGALAPTPRAVRVPRPIPPTPRPAAPRPR